MQKLALIIANSEYNDPKLARLVTPSKDAEALAEVLGNPKIGGFEVIPLINQEQRLVRREIARLYERKKKDDLLLLYYSGHGIKDDFGDLYLAVKDTETDFVSATAIDAAFVCDRIDKSSSHRKVVMLDCCHSGAFARGAKALGTTVGALEAFEGSGFGRVILTASNSFEYAWEGDKLLGEAETSVFTHFLVEGLQTGAADLNGNGEVSLDELYDYVHDQTLRSGKSRQTPQKWAQKVEGRIIIAENPFLLPADLPSELAQTIKSRFVGARWGAVIDLEDLLHGSNKGLALAAHEALVRLTDDDSRRVSDEAVRVLATSPFPSPAEPQPEPHPSLALTLSVKPQTVEQEDEATWTVILHNDGDDDLRHVTVVHGRTLLDEPFDLAVGKQHLLAFTTTYRTEGKKIERVTATGIASNDQTVRGEASATVQVRPRPKPEPEPHPSLALTLSIKPPTVDLGDEAAWTVTLHNDGDDDLRDVAVKHGETLLKEPLDLAAGKKQHFTFTTTYRTEGKKTEKVTVTGVASNDQTLRGEASATVQVLPQPKPAPEPESPPKRKPKVLTITSPTRLELVPVPAGEFLMGSDPAKDRLADDDERPQHRVYVSEFHIGRYPVTNAQFAAFVKATGHKITKGFKSGEIPLGRENHPVVFTSWDEAVAFCQWLGQETGKPFRLPTEAEWEKAARGTDGRIYPWGNEWDKSRLNAGKLMRGLASIVTSSAAATTPVGQYSPDGDSPCGASDMAGNVWEWCADWYDEEEYRRRADEIVKDPLGPEGREKRIVRGGAFHDSKGSVRCAFRIRVYPVSRYAYLGFRVALSPGSPE